MNWVLVIWLAVPSNYTVYEQFDDLKSCMDKRDFVQKALNQADSQMKMACRRIEDVLSEYDKKVVSFPVSI
jgi:hypothetical protein